MKMPCLPRPSPRKTPHYQKGLPFLIGAVPAGDAGLTATAVPRRYSTDGRDPGHELPALTAPSTTGAGEALHLLGLAYFRGEGVDRDLAEARRLQREAAEHGVVDAQFELSLLLAQGLGGPVDARGARRWEQRAAKAGHPRACLNWASRLARARRPDFAEVARWYARAAEAGSAEAAARLCKMHLAGQGVARNKGIARRWYMRAAKLGYAWTTGAEGAR